MKTSIVALLGLLLSHITMFAEIKSDGYVTFVNLANSSDLVPLTPTQHGWSYYGSVGTVYVHHRFYSSDGTEFFIDKLLSSVDNNGNGVYTSFVDVSGLSTPGTSPTYILKKDGVVLFKTQMKNTLCDEVIILNQVLGGRSASRGAKWKLDTDYPDVTSWTTHAPIHPFQRISIQNYINKLHVVVDGSAGQVVQYSYDLDTWSTYYTLMHNGITILTPPAVEAGKPKKFFRIQQ